MQQLSCIFKAVLYVLLRTDKQCCTKSISCAGNVIFWVRLDSGELPQPSSFSCLEYNHSCFFLRSSICWAILLPYAWTIPKKVAKHLKDRVRSPKKLNIGVIVVGKSIKHLHVFVRWFHGYDSRLPLYHESLPWMAACHCILSWSIMAHHDP